MTYISTSYRDAEYLKECNRSVLGQINVTAKHMVIVDGYESKELEEFQDNKKNCTRTIIIHNSRNKGKSACVNQAIQACQSRYIGLLDADDVIFPEKTTRQIRHLHQEENIAVVGCSYISFLDGNKTTMQFVQMPCKLEDVWQQIALAPTSLYSSLLIDRKRLPKPTLEEHLECAMDYDFNLKNIKKGIIENIPGFHCGYRIRNQSITRSEKRINQLINHSQILIRSMLSTEKYTKDQLRVVEALYALGLSEIANDSAEIRNSLRTALKTSPDVIRESIHTVRSCRYRGLDALLMNRVIDVLSIGAYGRR